MGITHFCSASSHYKGTTKQISKYLIKPFRCELLCNAFNWDAMEYAMDDISVFSVYMH